jgi:hypothetical protein
MSETEHFVMIIGKPFLDMAYRSFREVLARSTPAKCRARTRKSEQDAAMPRQCSSQMTYPLPMGAPGALRAVY